MFHSRALTIASLAFVSALACGPYQATSLVQVTAAATEKAPARPHVLVISIDGLRPVDLANPKLAIPTLRDLAKRGAVANGGVETVRPSLTYPAHTTMMTGVSPARHGIVANMPPDPRGKNQDGWLWYASDIRVPALWDLAKTAGLKTASVYWPVTVGADITVNMPQVWRAKIDEDEKLLLALTTPALAADLRAAKTRLPGEHHDDFERALVAEYVIRRENANLTLAYLTDLDTSQHAYGPGSKEAAEVLAMIDGYVAKLVAASRARDPQSNVVILSDHGFMNVTREFRPNVALGEGGFLQLDEAGKIRAWVASSWRWNGSGAILLHDPKDLATKERVRVYLESLAKDPENGILRVVDAKERAELARYPEVGFVLEMQPGTVVAGKTTGLRVAECLDHGAHGYDPKLPEMRASLLLQGPRIKPGASLENVRMEDVAPTIAALLGFEMREIEGRVLTEALR